MICIRLRPGHFSVCLRQFEALWGDCNKSRKAPLNAIIIIIITVHTYWLQWVSSLMDSLNTFSFRLRNSAQVKWTNTRTAMYKYSQSVVTEKKQKLKQQEMTTLWVGVPSLFPSIVSSFPPLPLLSSSLVCAPSAALQVLPRAAWLQASSPATQAPECTTPQTLHTAFTTLTRSNWHECLLLCVTWASVLLYVCV